MNKLAVFAARVDCSSEQDAQQAELLGQSYKPTLKMVEQWVKAENIIGACVNPMQEGWCYVDIAHGGTMEVRMRAEVVPILMQWAAGLIEIRKDSMPEPLFVLDTRSAEFIHEEISPVLLSKEQS